MRLHRGWRNCGVFMDEPMTEREAWLWLIENAAWKPTKRRNAKGEAVTIDRGQLHTSLRALESVFGWGKNKVDRFLNRLEDHDMIGTASGQSGTIITICNYARYQDTQDGLPSETGTRMGQPRDTQEEGKEIKEKNIGARARRLTPDFEMPESWIDWAVETQGWRRPSVLAEAEAFKDYWLGRAGQAGSKLDWEATWRNWVRRSKQANGYHPQPAVPL